MPLKYQGFALLTSSLGLFALNFAISLPAQASIVCEPETVSNYQNGSLASCVLGQDMNVQVSSSNSWISNFPCKAKTDISFDEKGQFKSCQLSQELQIKTGNSIQQCPADYKVYVSVANDGTKSINCGYY
jgi:hypothetical protein